MGYQKYRIRRKNSSGTYDILHVESQAGLILRYKEDGSENGTVESALATLENKVSTLEGASGVGSKADKVTNATNGNFAGLDASGNLTDSGKKAADFAAASHTHTISEVTGGTANRVAVYSSTGALAVSSITTTKLGYLSDVTSAIQSQLNGKAASDHNHDGAYAPLGSDSKVPAAYLPSYVDDVVEGYMNGGKLYKESAHTTEITGESGKIYVDLHTEKTYRWSGSAFVEISASLALGTTASTAFAGDKGKIAYDHSQTAHARADATKTEASATNGKVKINGSDVTVYTHPAYTTKALGFWKVQVDNTGHVSNASAVAASDIKGLSGINMSGASSSAAGAAGMVPAPAKGDQAKFLRGDGTWVVPTDNDTKVTSVGNHYAPAEDSSKELSADASSTTAATWGSTALVTGVNIKRDAAGHVVGVSVDSIRMPANPDTNTDQKTASSNSTNKLFLVGATSQSTAGQTTYSNASVYAQTGRIYSNNRKVLDVQFAASSPNDQAEGDLWFETIS